MAPLFTRGNGRNRSNRGQGSAPDGNKAWAGLLTKKRNLSGFSWREKNRIIPCTTQSRYFKKPNKVARI